MSTPEEPDGPMPLCMSPESYRAEITRRKSAERERDDLAKQAERLIEENEELRNRIARLDTWLGEANQFKVAAQNEADDLRANVATLAGQLEAAEANAAIFRADREGVYRNFEGAMNERDEARARLAEVERERDALRGPLVEARQVVAEHQHWSVMGVDVHAQRWALLQRIDAALAPVPPGPPPMEQFATMLGHLRNMTKSEPAEPRDEARWWVPLWKRAYELVTQERSQVEVFAELVEHAVLTTPGAREVQAGYAPHSGTAAFADAAARLEAAAPACSQAGRWSDAWQAAADYLRRLAAPPDGTAPAATPWLPIADDGPSPGASDDDCGCPRDEMEHLPGCPDGMPGEPDDEDRPLCHLDGYECDAHGPARRCHRCPLDLPACDRCGAVKLVDCDCEDPRVVGYPDRIDPNRTAPPTVPGEPPGRWRCEAERVARVGGNISRALLANLLAEIDATPPTPPRAPVDAEPMWPMREVAEAMAMEGFNAECIERVGTNLLDVPGKRGYWLDVAAKVLAKAGVTPRAPVVPARVCRVCGTDRFCLECSWVSEPACASVDEAAVRQDERARTERDIAEWLERGSVDDGLPNSERMRGWCDALHRKAEDIERSDYPRTGEPTSKREPEDPTDGGR